MTHQNPVNLDMVVDDICCFTLITLRLPKLSCGATCVLEWLLETIFFEVNAHKPGF